jgi:hypothetical protein
MALMGTNEKLEKKLKDYEDVMGDVAKKQS